MAETKVTFTVNDFANYFINRVMPLMKKYKKQHRKPFTSDHADRMVIETFTLERAHLISREEGQHTLEQAILGDDS